MVVVEGEVMSEVVMSEDKVPLLSLRSLNKSLRLIEG